ncbi:PASTA domain-containing protein [Kribbella kalugense]|uniref:PASTA domain-containing protein n=1 Tax=Kribbella kalugense TaxID=2512221 RepID=A0A4R8A2A0_9ACTN|nr:PASTA domain-containing protein [Kribbella kalugense]TDW22290.1 PASTA domain-containing protein [Kribbella kalugense]
MGALRAVGGPRWLVRALACASAVVIAVVMAGGAAYATGDGTARLRLDRDEGPPGTVVFASVQGYGGCRPAGVTTPAGGGVVEVFWEGIEDAVGSAVVPPNGSVEVMFSVPFGATAQRYSITSVCRTNAQLTDDDLFVVTGIASQLVRVPRVVGLKVAEAEAKVAALGLVLRVPSGAGDVVAGQSPTAGSMVRAGHAVRITTKQVVVAPARPAPEPAVVARAADPFPWRTTALVALAVLVAGVVSYRVVKWRLDKRWVRNHLRVVVPPAPALDPQLTESDSAPPMLVVRIQPHEDAGIHILQGG